MDVDNSGTVDSGELSFAFEQLGLSVDDQGIMGMVQKHAKKYAEEMEVTINEFFEMIEDQTHGGRAWFVTAVCVLVPDMDYDHEILAYREEEKQDQFDRKVEEVFDDLQRENMIKPLQMEFALEALGLHMEPQRLSMLIANIGGEGITFENFRMLINNQHTVDTNTFKTLTNKAQEQRKLEQRARSKLFHIKGNERRIRVLKVEMHYSSLNAGDVFLLDAWNALFLWFGKDSSEPEHDAGRNHVHER